MSLKSSLFRKLLQIAMLAMQTPVISQMCAHLLAQNSDHRQTDGKWFQQPLIY